MVVKIVELFQINLLLIMGKKKNIIRHILLTLLSNMTLEDVLQRPQRIY